MDLLLAREAVRFPDGDNVNDTLIAGVHLNKTVLETWNYTLYSNGTVSNGSWCFLTFPPYTPAGLLPNGTFINSTWCYRPVNPVGQRSQIGLGFAGVFAIALLLTLVSLTKHGRLFLPAEKRFWPIGRRWQWYWAAFVCACALISLIANVDVDRYYLPELPLVLTVFFWYLMQIGTIATIWEAVRHWGSWMERQFVDPNPFALPLNDRRAKFEFWLPLFFYFWAWMNFFLIVPRNWESIEHQRYPEEVLSDAIPTATDARFRAASFTLFICWLTICVSLQHSLIHYTARHGGFLRRATSLIRAIPLRFAIILPLALALVAYQAMVAFSWAYSPANLAVPDLRAIYAGGYAPALLAVLVNAVHGLATPNEDRELRRQRRDRGAAVDADLGIVHRPAWWRRNPSPNALTVRDRIARNVREIGARRGFVTAASPLADPPPPSSLVEMGNLRAGARGGAGAKAPIPVPAGFDAAAAPLRAAPAGQSLADRRALQAAELMRDSSPPPPYRDVDAARGRGRQPTAERDEDGTDGDGGLRPPPGAGRSASTGTMESAGASGPPVQIRSMLDV